MNWIRQEKRLAIYSRDNFSCVYCGESGKLTLDHVVPVASGGCNSHTNLVTSCLTCNSSKGKKSIKAFAKVAAKKIIAALSSELTSHKVTAKALIAKHGSAAKVLAAMA